VTDEALDGMLDLNETVWCAKINVDPANMGWVAAG